MTIYKNKITLLDWDEKAIAIIIESKAIAKSHKKFFEEQWKKAKE